MKNAQQQYCLVKHAYRRNVVYILSSPSIRADVDTDDVLSISPFKIIVKTWADSTGLLACHAILCSQMLTVFDSNVKRTFVLLELYLLKNDPTCCI